MYKVFAKAYRCILHMIKIPFGYEKNIYTAQMAGKKLLPFCPIIFRSDVPLPLNIKGTVPKESIQDHSMATPL